jgi:hypothetical protein
MGTYTLFSPTLKIECCLYGSRKRDGSGNDVKESRLASLTCVNGRRAYGTCEANICSFYSWCLHPVACVRSGDGGFYPSTQRHYRMLIYYTATCFGNYIFST